MDWAGIATLIGAVGSFLTVLVGLAIQIINFRDQRKMREEQDAHKQLLCSIKQDTASIKSEDAQ